MPRFHPAHRYMFLGLASSLAVHVGVGVVAGITPAGVPRHDDPVQGVEMALLFPEPAEAPDEPEEITLGLEESTAQTEAWVGFQESTDHQAAQSEVEQSALTPTPAGGQPTPASLASTPSPEPVAPAEADQPTDAPEPIDPPASEPTDQPPPEAPPIDPPIVEAPQPVEASPPELPIEIVFTAPPPLIPTPAPAPDPLLEMLPEPLPEHAIDPAILLAAPPPPLPAPAPDQPSPPEPAAQPESQPEPTAPPAPEAAPPSPASEPTPPGEGGLLPGEKSPSESSAAALDAPIDVRPGRVLAARGLQITTVRPVFSTSVLALARPRSPTLVIEFGYDGHVRRARYLPGKSTGEPEVDRPLLDAIYRWTAAGDPLKQLSEDPEDVVSITMRIILR